MQIKSFFILKKIEKPKTETESAQLLILRVSVAGLVVRVLSFGIRTWKVLGSKFQKDFL